MVALKLLELTMLLNLLSTIKHQQLGGLWSGKDKGQKLQLFPPACELRECPSYELIQESNGYEVRRYDSSVWVSTSPILDNSFVDAAQTGFYPIYDYIQGKNEYKKKFNMTSPVIAQVSPGNYPFCESSFVVAFYVPKESQADTPPAEGLHVQRWNSTYVAVRQFGDFASDNEVGEEVAALQVSLAGSKWADAIKKSQQDDPSTSYIVAQYNSPIEFKNRVNEIWFKFDMQDGDEI